MGARLKNYGDINGEYIKLNQACDRFNMSYEKITQLAKESGAKIKYGNVVLINAPKMSAYLAKQYTE